MAGGRPTVMTPDTVAKLEQAFLLGCSDLEACLFANIDKASLYRYQADFPEFRDRKETLKKNPALLARKAVIKSLKENDINTARWVLDKNDGKAKEHVELTGKDGGPIESSIAITADMTPKEAAKAFKEKYKNT